MSRINYSLKNVSTSLTLCFLFAFSLTPISNLVAQEVAHEGIKMRIANLNFEKVTVYDPENFNEVLIVMLKDKANTDIGTVTLSRVNYKEKTSLPNAQTSQTKVMENRKKDVTKMDKGVGEWVFKSNVKIDQHKAQYYELNSKIDRAGALYLIETTKDQILIKLVYKKGVDKNLIHNFKDWITDVKVLLNQSPKNN